MFPPRWDKKMIKKILIILIIDKIMDQVFKKLINTFYELHDSELKTIANHDQYEFKQKFMDTNELPAPGLFMKIDFGYDMFVSILTFDIFDSISGNTLIFIIKREFRDSEKTHCSSIELQMARQIVNEKDMFSIRLKADKLNDHKNKVFSDFGNFLNEFYSTNSKYSVLYYNSKVFENISEFPTDFHFSTIEELMFPEGKNNLSDKIFNLFDKRSMLTKNANYKLK